MTIKYCSLGLKEMLNCTLENIRGDIGSFTTWNDKTEFDVSSKDTWPTIPVMCK